MRKDERIGARPDISVCREFYTGRQEAFLVMLTLIQKN